MAQNAPIIIIKKKAAHGGHHGGAWKVAYADFVTAMMALFIVLWLLNSSKQIKVAVGGYFKDPTGKSKKVGNGESGSVGESFAVNKDNMDKIKDELAAAIHKVNITEKLKDQIEMTITAEGLRIELMETEKGAFFPSATKEPNDQGKELLVFAGGATGQAPQHVVDRRPYRLQALRFQRELLQLGTLFGPGQRGAPYHAAEWTGAEPGDAGPRLCGSASTQAAGS